MNKANLILISILLSVIILTDNNKADHINDINFCIGKIFPVAEITKVDLCDLGSRKNNALVYYLPTLIIKATSPQLDNKA